MISLRWNKDLEVLAVSLTTEYLQMFESPSTVDSAISPYLFDWSVCVCERERFAFICFSWNFQDIFHKNKIFISVALILYLLGI